MKVHFAMSCRDRLHVKPGICQDCNRHDEVCHLKRKVTVRGRKCREVTEIVQRCAYCVWDAASFGYASLSAALGEKGPISISPTKEQCL